MYWRHKKSFWVPPEILPEEEETQKHIERVLSNPKYKFVKFNKFYFLIRHDKSKKPFVYWTKKIDKNYYIHSRTERLNKDMTDEELYKYIKFPKYQWIRDKSQSRYNKIDWTQLEVWELYENFDLLQKKYPINNLKLHQFYSKRKRQTRYYISYQVVINNILYNIKTKTFSAHERSYENLLTLVQKKYKKYLIEEKDLGN